MYVIITVTHKGQELHRDAYTLSGQGDIEKAVAQATAAARKEAGSNGLWDFSISVSAPYN